MSEGSRRIKVLNVINSIGLGGVPEAAYQILSRLPAETYDRHLVVMRNLDEDDPSRVARFERIKSLGLPVTFLCPSDHKLGAVTQMVDILANGAFDVLHCHSYRPKLFARLAGSLMRPRGLNSWRTITTNTMPIGRGTGRAARPRTRARDGCGDCLFRCRR